MGMGIEEFRDADFAEMSAEEETSRSGSRVPVRRAWGLGGALGREEGRSVVVMEDGSGAVDGRFGGVGRRPPCLGLVEVGLVEGELVEGGLYGGGFLEVRGTAVGK